MGPTSIGQTTVVALVVMLTITACGGGGSGTTATTEPTPAAATAPAAPPPIPVSQRQPLPPTTELRSIVDGLGLTGDPAAGRNLPTIDDPVAQLGRQLFFTKALGGEMDTACASCHHPMLGGGDGLSLPVGVGAIDPDLLGPGRKPAPGSPRYDGGPVVPRNAPTTFNAALWDRVMFHDGRVEAIDPVARGNGAGARAITTPDAIYPLNDPDAGPNLVTAQARFPITSAEEMLGLTVGSGLNTHGIRRLLCARLGNFGSGRGKLPDGRWEAAFREAFHLPDEPVTTLITSERIVFALGEYQRSQVFTETPWKAWVLGNDDAISEPAKRGALLFFLPPARGGAGCARCHSGDNFTDEAFHVLATPQIGHGKGDGPNGTNDFGRFHVTGNDDDRFAFRTPSLLNVTVTGPWSHAGAYTTLRAMIRHHLDPEEAVASYNYRQIDPAIRSDQMAVNTAAALAALKRLQQRGRSKLTRLELTDEEVSDLEAFLATLTDPCVTSRTCLAPWLPAPDDPDPDGLRLKAHDRDGRPL